MQRRAISTGTIYGGVRTVTLLPGDGVGSEMAAAIKTIFRAAHVPIEFEQFDLTGVTNEKTSSKLDQALASIRKNKVALKGFWFTPVSRLSHKSWNGALRNELDVYASLSLVKNLPGPWPTRHKNVDFAIIRENTEGEYSGKEHSVKYINLARARCC
jgi:isocitrate dehydrogenase (NAD+)